MSEEERKAIEYFNRRIKNVKTLYTSIYFKVKNLKIILNLIEKQDKMIDLMAEMLRYYNGSQQIQEFCIDICEDKLCDEENCEKCIKEYFRKKVEND